MPLRLALSTGEPAGIGPDLTIQIAQSQLPCELVAIGDQSLLKSRAKQLGLPLTIRPYEASAKPEPSAPGELCVYHVPLIEESIPGQPSKANAPYVLSLLDVAINGCMSGEFSGLVTAPVHKGIINDAGVAFSGHTEYLADATHTKKVVMMLASPNLRVALVTTHLPLSEVPAAITEDNLSATLRILHHQLQKDFGLASPTISVCGLNPHAGEGGHLGREELDTIIPCLEKLRAEEGMLLHGPLPADTAFTPHALDGVDAVLAMYHDQGLPVLKHQGFSRSVNITLGLPIVRTSVDHGTALELAGTGNADTGSLYYALEIASQMASNQSSKNSL